MPPRVCYVLRMSSIGLLPSLLACQLGLQAIVPDDAPEPGNTTTFVPDPITLGEVSPAWGLTSGGAEVRIAGGPFDGSVEVTLAGKPAEVLEVSADQLVVRTPSVSQPGVADLEVTTASGAGSAEGAFVYHADGTDRFGAYGVFVWTSFVGGYWDANATDAGSAWLAVTTPSDEALWEYYAPAMDRCVREGAYTSGSVLRVYDAVPEVSLMPPVGEPVALAFDSASGTYTASGLTSASWRASTPYDLADMAPAGIPAFTQEGLVATPAAFSVTAPALGSTSLPSVSRGFTLRWDGREADWVLVSLQIVTAEGDWGDVVTCVAEDDGSFTVPSDAFASWPTGDYLYVKVARMRRGTGLRSFDHAGSQVYGAYQVSGAARMQ
ncbi:MAG: hypothetical protein RLZZ299_2563 [Pseudomonadota bacterium]